MERLDRTPGAGGRRKARRQEQEPDNRSQRGTRAEETRSDRKAKSKTSRRQSEAQSRKRAESSHVNQASQPANSQGAEQGAVESGAASSFKSHLAFQELPQGTGPNTLGLSSAPDSGSELNHGFVPIQNNLSQAQPEKLSGAVTNNTVASGLAGATGATRASSAATQLAAAVPGVAQATGPKQKKIASVPVAVAAPELSESQEAQRSSQVMRQLRMHLNPGMRSATVHLHPAELGRIQVRLRTANGEVHATLTAESEEALAILERHVPELEAAFVDQGYGEMSFEFVLDQQGSNDPGAWNFDRDVSAELEARVEKQMGSQLRASNLISDLGVDTYA